MIEVTATAPLPIRVAMSPHTFVEATTDTLPVGPPFGDVPFELHADAPTTSAAAATANPRRDLTLASNVTAYPVIGNGFQFRRAP
jgi:hypothetical protein